MVTRKRPRPRQVQRLSLDPGDVLVVECPGILSLQVVQTMKDELRRMFPGHRVLVLTDGAKLTIGVPARRRRTERRKA